VKSAQTVKTVKTEFSTLAKRTFGFAKEDWSEATSLATTEFLQFSQYVQLYQLLLFTLIHREHSNWRMNMSFGNCECCGTSFWRAEGDDWKTLCLPCYKRKARTRRADPNELAELRAENRRLRIELVELRYQATVAPLTAPTIPREMLRRLLHLAHPDRHNGSEAATLATQWLLEQREVRQ
jgi:hypothetical protein